MSSSAPWKDLERRHARRFLRGKRLWRPDFSDSQPDGESLRDYWDTKYRQSMQAVTLFVESEKKYKDWDDKKRFHMCFHVAGIKGDFVMIRAGHFATLVQTEDQLLEDYEILFEE